MRINPIFNSFNNKVDNSRQAQLSGKNKCAKSYNSQNLVFGKNKKLINIANKEFFSQIISVINDKGNIIGSGCEGVVYSIPNTGYCIKVPYECDISHLKVTPRNIITKLEVKDKINHIVAKLKDGAVVMEKIVGVPVWTPNMEKSLSQKNSEVVANLPEHSYRDFLNQIVFASKNDMIFDSFNYNVILNEEKQTINAIDFIKNSKNNFDYEMNPLQAMFYSLVNPETTMEQKQKIAKKILIVALDELKSGKESEISPYEFDFCEFAEFLEHKGVLKLGQNFIDLIDKITYYKDLEMVKNIHKSSLNIWINQAKKIIKQNSNY